MRVRAIGVVGVVALVSMFFVPLQAADSQVGTWKVNIAKSTYSPGPAPKSSTVKIEAAGNGVKLIVDAVGNDGTATHTEYTAGYDGKDVRAMVGSLPGGADTIALKRVDANTVEGTAKLKGKVMTTTRYVISADGKTRTVTATGTTANGKPAKNVIVYDRQ